jgi:hypothetical protein
MDMIMSTYGIPNDVYTCESHGHVVFLNLKTGRYQAIPPELVGYLKELLESSSTDRHALNREILPASGSGDETTELAEMLEQQGLLVRGSSRGERPRTLSGVQIQVQKDEERDVLPRLELLDLFNFVAAWLFSSFMFKFVPLRIIARRVQKRRRAAERRQVACNHPDEAINLTNVFLIIQPIFYRSRDMCLKNSLTMIEFLARYDVFPDWVFGVQLHPFAAHCWVQAGPTVLNDTAARVSSFTPIMVL